jgi:hypothetical protein
MVPRHVREYFKESFIAFLVGVIVGLVTFDYRYIPFPQFFT